MRVVWSITVDMNCLQIFHIIFVTWSVSGHNLMLCDIRMTYVKADVGLYLKKFILIP